MAISHANKTMVNHVRSDGSSFHVVDYNGDTGAVSDKRTSQGYADNRYTIVSVALAIHLISTL